MIICIYSYNASCASSRKNGTREIKITLDSTFVGAAVVALLVLPRRNHISKGGAASKGSCRLLTLHKAPRILHTSAVIAACVNDDLASCNNTYCFYYCIYQLLCTGGKSEFDPSRGYSSRRIAKTGLRHTISAFLPLLSVRQGLLIGVAAVLRHSSLTLLVRDGRKMGSIEIRK